MAIKRLHYYNQQFLVEPDFTDEQRYHVSMRRRLSRVLHTFGIAEGLEVQKTANQQVTVKQGTATDKDGREIVLDTDAAPVDVSGLPSNATVFVTIAYQETQSDPSSATGAPGNTRFTEAPLLQATATAPPTDGSVILLARFDKAGTDVPGPLNGFLDGGVRQSAGAKIAPGAIAETNLAPALVTKINTPTGIVSVGGVSNPGGNVIVSGANAIQVNANVGTKTLTITENHSTILNANPHNTAANQLVGYDLRARAFGAIQFSQADATGATRTLNLTGATPRIVLAISSTSALLGTRSYGSGCFGFFDAATGVQRCFGSGFSFNALTDWFVRSGGVNTAGICSANFFDNSFSPARTEDLVVTVSVAGSVLTATLARTSSATPLASFTLTINLFYMGA